MIGMKLDYHKLAFTWMKYTRIIKGVVFLGIMSIAVLIAYLSGVNFSGTVTMPGYTVLLAGYLFGLLILLSGIERWYLLNKIKEF
jgi:hypothetical protein